jgi:hypothetical protein
MTLDIRRVIDGKLYNTETAEEVCDMSSNHNRGDFHHHTTKLFRSRKGQYFVAGEGNALSRWSRPIGNNGSGGGDGLYLVTADEARKLAEKHCRDVETIALFFGEPEEG